MRTSGTTAQVGRKASLVVGLLFLVLAISPISTHAHAALLSTDPADGAILETAPENVTLTFSESVSAVDGGTVLHVRGSDPRPLEPSVRDETVTVPLPTDLTEGTYALQWRVISADGHPIAGTLMFSIGQPTQAADVAAPATSTAMDWGLHTSVWAKYLGLLVTFGLLIGGWSYARRDWTRLVRVARWTAVIGIAGAVLELPFVAAVQAGESRWRWHSVRQIDDGTLIVAAVVVCGMVVFLVASKRWSLRVVATVAVAVACLAPLLTGHTRTKSPEWLMMLSDTVHILAGSFWIGGLLILTLGLWRRDRLVTFSSSENAVVAVSRFSVAAAWSVTALAISGTAMAWMILETPRDLIDTGYGRDLLLKIALVLMVICLATLNRYRLLPRLIVDRDHALHRLRQVVLGELILLVAVVGVTSVMVQQNPSHIAQAAEPTVLFQGSAVLDKDHTAEITVRESESDQVTVEITISTADGPLTEPIDGVTAEWTLSHEGLGPITVDLARDESTGSYVGATTLPSSGDWTITIRAKIDRFTDSRGSVTIPVP